MTTKLTNPYRTKTLIEVDMYQFFSFKIFMNYQDQLSTKRTL